MESKTQMWRHTGEIANFYDMLEYDYIVKILERLKKSYYIAYKFISGIGTKKWQNKYSFSLLLLI